MNQPTEQKFREYLCARLQLPAISIVHVDRKILNESDHKSAHKK